MHEGMGMQDLGMRGTEVKHLLSAPPLGTCGSVPHYHSQALPAPPQLPLAVVCGQCEWQEKSLQTRALLCCHSPSWERG